MAQLPLPTKPRTPAPHLQSVRVLPRVAQEWMPQMPQILLRPEERVFWNPTVNLFAYPLHSKLALAGEEQSHETFPDATLAKGTEIFSTPGQKSFAKASLFYSHRSHQTNACSLYLKEPKGGNRS